jgi:predicted glycosyltransferase
MEQWDQVLKFQGFGAIDQVVDDTATSPAALAALMEGTLAAPAPSRRPIDLGGAAAAARLLARAVREKTAAD